MHIPDFSRMAVTWDLEKLAFRIYEKNKSTGQDHEEGWSYFLKSPKDIAETS